MVDSTYHDNKSYIDRYANMYNAADNGEHGQRCGYPTPMDE